MLVCNNVLYKSTYHKESGYAIWNASRSFRLCDYILWHQSYCIEKLLYTQNYFKKL